MLEVRRGRREGSSVTWEPIEWGTPLNPASPRDFFGVFWDGDNGPFPLALFAGEEEAREWAESRAGSCVCVVRCFSPLGDWRAWNSYTPAPAPTTVEGEVN